MGYIRVSAASLARIELDGKLLLVLNRARLQAERKIYTPFGGALEFYGLARPFLVSIGADFEKDNDIRFVIFEEGLPKFENWFYQQIERESSPYRELREELVNEEGVLPNLPKSAVNLEYLTTTTGRAVTDRPGQEGKVTQRFFEIYRATFNHEYKQMLRTALAQLDTHLGLVTEREIIVGVSDSGIEIATNCKPMI
ncbi:hypothetical protein HZC30_08215 [Candidatus Woesearchaeota archaeon]|nr:hypothetical protein [Candidatus Woesearchaeota archaeon]